MIDIDYDQLSNPPDDNYNSLLEEIKEYEEKYNMSSDEMRKRVARGTMEETHDISTWNYLINVRDLNNNEST